MKMHSYMNINGQLQYAAAQRDILLATLRKATLSVGGWDQAMKDAKAHRKELEGSNGMNGSNGDIQDSPLGTPSIILSEGTSSSYVDVPTSIALRKRLIQVSNNNKTAATEKIATESINSEPSAPSPVGPHPLSDHPDPNISAIAKDYSEVEAELTSPGPNYVKWPNNITWKDFSVYMLIPTLVYELEYPRTER